MSRVQINMMGTFSITCSDSEEASQKLRSRKGSLLIQFLILSFPKQVSSDALIETLSLNRTSDNPQNALKTLISRTRILLSGINECLNGTITSKHGTYAWHMNPEMSVDLFELYDLFDSIAQKKTRLPDGANNYARIVELYKGDLFYQTSKPAWIETITEEIHGAYLSCVYDYLDYLKNIGDAKRRLEVCRKAMSVDEYDKQIYSHLMQSQNGELPLREESPNVYYGDKRYLDAILDKGVERLSDELNAHAQSSSAFYCEYDVFKNISEIQQRIVERLGSSMFIALISLNPINGDTFYSVRLRDVTRCLLDTLKESLRKGDAITQYSPLSFAITLPMVDYATSRSVLERIKESFYIRNSQYKDAVLSYRTHPLYYVPGGSI